MVSSAHSLSADQFSQWIIHETNELATQIYTKRANGYRLIFDNQCLQWQCAILNLVDTNTRRENTYVRNQQIEFICCLSIFITKNRPSWWIGSYALFQYSLISIEREKNHKIFRSVRYRNLGIHIFFRFSSRTNPNSNSMYKYMTTTTTIFPSNINF